MRHALLAICTAIAIAAAESWPDLPDPIGLGPRLVVIEWLRERGVKLPAGATDTAVQQAYAQYLAGPANRLHDGTTDWEAAHERDATQRLRRALKSQYDIDVPDTISLADAETYWRQAETQKKHRDAEAIERLKENDRRIRESSPDALPQARRIGIPEADVERLMDPRFTGRQRGMNWCWAACISMVCAYHQVRYSQEDIVRDIKGVTVDEAGSVLEMLVALSQQKLQPNGQPIQLVPNVIRDFNDIGNELVKKQPVIVALFPPGQDVGHAVVLTSIEFDAANNPVFIVRDPSPQVLSRQRISERNFMQMYRAGLRLRVVRF